MTKYPIDHKFEEGDEVFVFFKKWTVKTIRGDGSIADVSDGHGCMSGNFRHEAYPVDPVGITITDEFREQYERIRNSTDDFNLNYPDIRSWFIERWECCMNIRHDGSHAMVGGIFEEVAAFVDDVIFYVQFIKKMQIKGVLLVRR